MTFNSARPSDDSGLTLVELVIYSALSVVIAVIVTFMLINTLKGQATVTAVTTATTRGQVIAEGIERAVRNSTDFTISPDGTTLTVLTTLSVPCQAWRVNAGVLEISQGPTASWKPFAQGVSLADGSSAFFSRTGTSLDYGLAFATDSAPVTFSGEVLPRTMGGSVATTCS